MRLSIKRSKTSALALLAGTGLACVGIPNDAHALLMLSANVGGELFHAEDNGVNDLDPDVGQLQLANQTIGGLSLRGSFHTSTKGSVPGTLNRLNSSSLSVTNNSGSTVHARVVVGDKDFRGPSFVARTSGSGTFEGTPGSSINMAWYDDPGNNQPAEFLADTPGNKIDGFGFVSTTDPESFSHNGGPFTVSDPVSFAMALVFDYTLLNGSALISRGQAEVKEVAAVPEPGTLGILGAGLAGLGWVLHRRRAQGPRPGLDFA